jgi:hypothetical protein
MNHSTLVYLITQNLIHPAIPKNKKKETLRTFLKCKEIELSLPLSLITQSLFVWRSYKRKKKR